MGVVYCLVCGGEKCEGIRLHLFPKDEKRSAEWQRAMFGDNHKIVTKMRRPGWKICSRHFEKHNYFYKDGSLLKKNAVPTLMPSYTSIATVDNDVGECVVEIQDSPSGNLCLFCMTELTREIEVDIENCKTQQQIKVSDFIRNSVLNVRIEEHLFCKYICKKCLELINQLEGHLIQSSTIQTTLENQYIEHSHKQNEEAEIIDLCDDNEHNYQRKDQLKSALTEAYPILCKALSEDITNDQTEGVNSTQKNAIVVKKRRPPRGKYNKIMIDKTLSSYCCEKCGMVFLSYDGFHRHLQKYHHGQVYRCDVCKKSFPTMTRLKDHKTVHTGERPYECETCGKKFRLRMSWRHHTSAMHPTEDSAVHCCDICGKTYTSLYGFKKHLLKHRNENKFRCDICDKTFTMACILRDHKMIHTDIRPVECTICEKRFRTKASLKMHLASHSDQRDFQCHLCVKAFKTQTQLTNHLKKHFKKYQCIICGKSFAENFVLTKHRKMCHSSENVKEVISSGKVGLECPICGKICAHKFTYNMHMEFHKEKRNFQCEKCEKSFVLKSHLKMHMKLHAQSKPFSCTMCGKGFAQENSLQKHMDIHNPDGFRLYDCDICGKKLANSHSFKAHMNGHVRRNYECELCPRTFVFKFNLTNHMKVHLPNKKAEPVVEIF